MTLITEHPAYCADLQSLPLHFRHGILQGLFERTGALRQGEFLLGVGTGVRGVSIAPGRYFLLGSEASDQGGYLVTSLGAADNVNLPAAVGNPYIASIILRVKDLQYGASPPSHAEIEYFTGVAAASPTALPDSTWNVGGAEYVPGAWARLGDVRVNVGDTGALPAGQIVSADRYASDSVRLFNSWHGETIAEAKTGDVRYNRASGTYERHVSGLWVPMVTNVQSAIQSTVQGAALNSPTDGSKVATNLAFYMVPNGVYEATYRLRHWGDSGRDAAIDFTLPAGGELLQNSLVIRSLLGGASSTSDPLFSGTFFSSPSGATIGLINTSTGTFTDVYAVFKNGATAGQAVLNFGQKNAGATASSLAGPSTVTATRIA